MSGAEVGCVEAGASDELAEGGFGLVVGGQPRARHRRHRSPHRQPRPQMAQGVELHQVELGSLAGRAAQPRPASPGLLDLRRNGPHARSATVLKSAATSVKSSTRM